MANSKSGSVPKLVDRFQAYLISHVQAMFASLGRQIRSPFTWAMTTLVMAIALALTGGFYSLVKNAGQLTDNIDASNQISVFLKQQTDTKTAQKLADKLADDEQVRSVKLIDSEQALAEFKEYSGFGEALNSLDENPLPSVIQVMPEAGIEEVEAMNALVANLNQLANVDFVQVDMQWLQRLQAFMQLLQRGVELFSLLIASGVIFITGNTIRLELQNRKEEVLIAKLVGADNSFIRRPFLYSGFWYGLFAGIIAWMLTTTMLLVIQTPVSRLATLYSTDFTLQFLTAEESFCLLLLASALGVLGAWSVLISQLQAIKPE